MAHQLQQNPIATRHLCSYIATAEFKGFLDCLPDSQQTLLELSKEVLDKGPSSPHLHYLIRVAVASWSTNKTKHLLSPAAAAEYYRVNPQEVKKS
jgi:hypothetical protein